MLRREPNQNSCEPSLSDQDTAELFYRWLIPKAVAVTPDLQWIKNLAASNEADSIWVFGLRVRGALWENQSSSRTSLGTLMGHFFTTIHIVSIDHHKLKTGEEALNQ